MITIFYSEINGEEKKANIPTSWSDVSWCNWVDRQVVYASQLAQVADYSGISVEILSNNLKLLEVVYNACKFLYEEDIETYIDYIPTNFRAKIKEVGEDDWGKLETARQELAKDVSNKWSGASEVIELYINENVRQLPCTDVLGMACFFLHK